MSSPGDDFRAVVAQARDQLLKRAAALEACLDADMHRFPLRVHLDVVAGAEAVFSTFDAFKGQNCVYWFDVERADAERIKTDHQRIYEARRLAVSKPNPVTSGCLYVGSTTGSSLRTRLQQHLGLSKPTKTYALYLRHWGIDPSLELTLEVVALRTASPSAAQDLEDAISVAKRPMCGKRGNNPGA